MHPKSIQAIYTEQNVTKSNGQLGDLSLVYHLPAILLPSYKGGFVEGPVLLGFPACDHPAHLSLNHLGWSLPWSRWSTKEVGGLS